MHPPNHPDPDDPITGDPPTPGRVDDRRAADRPICRVFGGPTSHRVQFAGPESRPATGTDAGDNDRPADDLPADDRPDDDPPDRGSDAFRAAGGRAIAALLERRTAALERALDSVREDCWRGESPAAADLRAARSRLDELQVAVEEYLARACPGADPWESAGEHVPEARLWELLEAAESTPNGLACECSGADDDESDES